MGQFVNKKILTIPKVIYVLNTDVSADEPTNYKIPFHELPLHAKRKCHCRMFCRANSHI